MLISKKSMIPSTYIFMYFGIILVSLRKKVVKQIFLLFLTLLYVSSFLSFYLLYNNLTEPPLQSIASGIPLGLGQNAVVVLKLR